MYAEGGGGCTRSRMLIDVEHAQSILFFSSFVLLYGHPAINGCVRKIQATVGQRQQPWTKNFSINGRSTSSVRSPVQRL
jgi:hypothetical protein